MRAQIFGNADGRRLPPMAADNVIHGVLAHFDVVATRTKT